MCSLFIDIYASVLQFPSIKSVKWIKVKAVNTVRHLRIQESINDSITIQRPNEQRVIDHHCSSRFAYPSNQNVNTLRTLQQSQPRECVTVINIIVAQHLVMIMVTIRNTLCINEM